MPASFPALPAAGQHTRRPLARPAAPPLLQGTQRGAAAGFKLDTLLKLADVKGTDRKTSLLHFVITQARSTPPGQGWALACAACVCRGSGVPLRWLLVPLICP